MKTYLAGSRPSIVEILVKFDRIDLSVRNTLWKEFLKSSSILQINILRLYSIKQLCQFCRYI